MSIDNNITTDINQYGLLFKTLLDRNWSEAWNLLHSYHPNELLNGTGDDDEQRNKEENHKIRAAIHEQATYIAEDGWTPLHMACATGAPSNLICVLIQVNVIAAQIREPIHKNTPLHLYLGGMARHEVNVDVIESLAKASPACVTMLNGDGHTPLDVLFRQVHQSFEDGSVDGNKLEVTPQIVEALLNTDVTQVTTSDYKGRIPIDYWGSLLTRFEVMYQACFGSKAFESTYGYKAGNVDATIETVRLLIEKMTVTSRAKANFNENGNKPEFLPVHKSFKVDHCPLNFACLYLRTHPSEARLMDEDGNFILHLAANAQPHQLTGRGKGCNDGSKVLKWSEWTHTDGGNDNFVYNRLASSNHHLLVEILLVDIINQALKIYPEAASIPDKEGRLPLHIAIESGKTWETGVKIILDAEPMALTTRGVSTGMLPFMMAAVNKTRSKGSHSLTNNDNDCVNWKFKECIKANAKQEEESRSTHVQLTTVFELLLSDPTCVSGFKVSRTLY